MTKAATYDASTDVDREQRDLDRQRHAGFAHGAADRRQREVREHHERDADRDREDERDLVGDDVGSRELRRRACRRTARTGSPTAAAARAAVRAVRGRDRAAGAGRRHRACSHRRARGERDVGGGSRRRRARSSTRSTITVMSSRGSTPSRNWRERAQDRRRSTRARSARPAAPPRGRPGAPRRTSRCLRVHGLAHAVGVEHHPVAGREVGPLPSSNGRPRACRPRCRRARAARARRPRRSSTG